MIKLWVWKIKNGLSTIENVPDRYKKAVEEMLENE